MTTPITLQSYQHAERELAHGGARTGMVIHAVVTLVVSALLIVINVTLAAQFPWSAFPVGGMSIGLAAHWWFGYRNLDTELDAQQKRVEARAGRFA